MSDKSCVSCLRVFPATTNFFYASRKHRDGLKRRCKPCDRIADKETRSGIRSAKIESLPRVAGKFCLECAGLPHRVTGVKCRLCGLRREEEAKPELQTRRA
jgi:hypothetical protein